MTHSNLGATWVARAKDATGARATTVAFSAGQSVIWLARSAFNALVEIAWSRSESVAGPDQTVHTDSFFISPGVRWAHNFRSGL